MAIHGEHYSSETGKSYHSEAERSAAEGEHSGASGRKGGGGKQGGGGILIIGFVVIGVAWLITGLMLSMLVLRIMAPVTLVIFVLSLPIFIVSFIVLGRVLPGFLRRLRGLMSLATVVALILGSLALSDTMNTGTLDPPVYLSDHVQTLNGGTGPEVHAQRGGKGKTLASLAAGDKVTVNGITRDREDFNITTSEGVTGWLPPGAFPDDALPRKDISLIKMWVQYTAELPRGGWGRAFTLAREEYTPKHRDWVNIRNDVLPKYVSNAELVTKDDGTKSVLLSGSDGTLTAAARRFEREVNVEITPAVFSNLKKDKRYTEHVEKFKAKLASVVFTPETTIVKIDDPNDIMWWAGIDYERTLVLRDLDSGTDYPIWDNLSDSTKNGKLYFFPPVKLQRFSLTHTGKPDDMSWDVNEAQIGGAVK